MQKLFSLFVFLFTCITFSQTPIHSFERIKEAQSNFFQLDRENIFLHFNKTKFVPQEGVWFTAYSYSSKNLLPHTSTTNLQVKLFDKSGKEVASKVIFIYEGVGEGFFDITELGLTPGIYQIKASTNYMKNFREDLAFHETIEILGNYTSAENSPSVKKAYDLQMLPEGGHFLTNVNNSVGVKLIDQNGKGVEFLNAELKNSKNETITNFKSNSFGLAKFNFTPTVGEKYKVVVYLANENNITSSLPPINTKGIALSVNNLHPTQVILSIQTNRETLKEIQQKPYTVLVHQNGNMNAMEFLFPNNNTQVILPIKKSSLNPGVNTITIFNEKKQPILERLVYKEITAKRIDASVSLKKNHIDSLEYEVQLTDNIKKGSLSISVLPSATKSYTSTQSIASAFFLEPYLKGQVENASYYFDKENPRQRFYDLDLDLLLLTQGWSKYRWNDVFNHPPKNFYESEVGFSLNGKVNNYNPKKIDQVYVKSNHSGLFEVIELDNTGNFTLDSLFVIKTDSLYIGSIKKRNDKTKKPQLFITALPKNKVESIERLRLPTSNKKDVYAPTNFNTKSFISDEVLDTVILQGENINRVRSRSSAFEDVIVFDEDISNFYQFFLDYIITKGYDVIRGINNVSIRSRRQVSTINGVIPTKVFIDGMPIDYEFSNMLLILKTKDIEEVILNKSGVGQGLFGAGGTIEIITKKSYGYKNTKVKELALKYELQDGFSSNKSFYAPKYSSFSSEDFQKYGVIHWVPSLNFDNQNSKSFKFLNTLTEEITFYIEGLTTEGKIISEKINIKP
ncbi:hypothetical protein LX95_01149 [Mesonia algae]|uniref:TonB-dependent receptor-like protein n=1 Tax=Mesonia algae TaxID=213248 RepID=A0A2W7IS41_9FLAO|nr:hypothetical protein [Mesonia algae]PZW41473.1 hypothetical protein LX95_01149 [Mesonia algae]